MAQRQRANAPLQPRPQRWGAAEGAISYLETLWSRESLLRLALSLILALALWLFITNKQDPRVAKDYPQPLAVTVSNIPDGMTVVNSNLGVVYVRFRRTDPNTPVSSSSFRPYINLLGLKPGLHRVPVHVDHDPGIDVVSWRPSSVPVLLEHVQSRRIPVRWHVVSQPPAGYGTEITVHPSTVVASGPDEIVSQASRATFDLDLANLSSTVSGTYKVSPENSQGALLSSRITLTPQQVHVTVKIQGLSSYKTLPVLPPLRGRPRPGFGVTSVTVDPAQITASGSPTALSRISTVKTRPISLKGRGAGVATAKVSLVLPAGIRSRTKQVTVRTRVAAVESSDSVELALTPVGVGANLTVRTEPSHVLVTVLGSSTALRHAASQMHAVVNLSGYGAGTYTFTPSVTVPSGIQLEGVYPSTVTVRLSSTPGA